MKNHMFRKHLLLFFLLGLMSPLLATDGYFSIAYATRHKGLAGAGLGWRSTTLIGGNPAARSFLGTQYSFNLGLFAPSRQYSVIGNPSQSPNTFGLTPGTYESGSTSFLLPSLGANWGIGEKSALGLAVYGNGGMNTDYDTRTFYDPSSMSSDGWSPLGKVTNLTGVNLSQLFVEATYSAQFAEGHSLGFSALIAVQTFEAKGLASFAPASGDAANLSGNGRDNSSGFGFKIGYLGELSEQFSIGATYQSTTFMSEFDSYAGLFAENGDFDIPSWYGIGIAFSPNEDLTLMADYKRINYSEVNAINNPMLPQNLFPGFVDQTGNPQANPNFTPLGSENAAGFGWEDMNVFKVALEYGGVDGWDFRLGYSYGQQPIPDSEVLFNILAPGVVEHHIALGFSRDLGEKSQLHFSLNYVPENTLSGANPLEAPGQQSIELSMSQLDFQIGITF